MQRLFDSLQLAAGSWESLGGQVKGDQGPADVIRPSKTPHQHPYSGRGRERGTVTSHYPCCHGSRNRYSLYTFGLFYTRSPDDRPPGFALRTLQENLIWLGICNPAIEDKRALADRPLARINALIGWPGYFPPAPSGACCMPRLYYIASIGQAAPRNIIQKRHQESEQRTRLTMTVKVTQFVCVWPLSLWSLPKPWPIHRRVRVSP